MSRIEKEGSSRGTPYSIRFRAQFGDVGPFEFQKTELSLDVLNQQAYECWPKDDKSVSVPLCAEDIKFIWNGRVLTSAEDLIDACQQYFSSIPLEKEGDEILTLHAVVRPPKPPMKKKGKKKIDSRHSSENVANTRGGLDCSCCVIM